MRRYPRDALKQIPLGIYPVACIYQIPETLKGEFSVVCSLKGMPSITAEKARQALMAAGHIPKSRSRSRKRSQILKVSIPTHGDLLPPARFLFLKFLQPCRQLETKCSGTWAWGSISGSYHSGVGTDWCCDRSVFVVVVVLFFEESPFWFTI